jgi:uncharacterized delta-60 repeat protein
MKKTIYYSISFIFFTLVTAFPLVTQAEEPFVAQTIGGIGVDVGHFMIQTTDGGYLMAGKTTSFGAGSNDAYIIKLTSDGSLDTTFGSGGTRTVGGAGNDYVYSMIQTTDGGFALVGGTYSGYGAGYNDAYIIKLTSTGALSWTRTIGGTKDDHAHSIIQTTDGGYIITGYTNSFGAGERDFYIIKLTSDGSLDTTFGSGGTRTVGGAGSDLPYFMTQTTDGSYIITGWTTSFGAGSNDAYIIKLTSDGSLDTTFGSGGTRTVGGAGNDYVYSSIQTTDDGYVIVGKTNSFGAGSDDAYIIKLTSDGSLDTSFGSNGTRTIGGTGNDYARSVIQASDGGYIIAGWTNSYGAGNYDMYIVKLTATGALDTSFGSNGTRTVGGTGNDYAFNIIQTTDGGYVVGGYTQSYGAGDSDFYIIKLTANGTMYDCVHSSGSGGEIGSGGTLNSTGGSISSGGTASSGGTLNATGGTLTQQCTITPLEDTTIQNPNPTDIQQAVTDGYITIDNGTIDNTTQTTTQVNVTYRTTNIDALFPTGTVVTETNTNPFNFQNFTLESQNIKNEQPESRSAFRLGIEGTNLTFSQPITITTFVGEAFNTQTLDILYQNEGETTWNTHGTCAVENGQCTFQTNHATIYTINGTLQSTGDAPLNINTEVLDTLTMDCYETTNGSGTYDVLLGTVSNPGYVTAGTPAIGQSTCTVTTNDDQGYYLTVEDDNGISSTVLTHTDPNTGALYEIQDLTHWNDTTLTTESWNPPTTKGLGFSIITFPDTDTSNNIFDGIWTETGNCPEGTTADTNDYAGIPDTPETIAAVPQYTANHTTTNICYKVDVPTSQPSGVYTGSVTYTATSDASSYLN